MKKYIAVMLTLILLMYLITIKCFADYNIYTEPMFETFLSKTIQSGNERDFEHESYFRPESLDLDDDGKVKTKSTFDIIGDFYSIKTYFYNLDTDAKVIFAAYKDDKLFKVDERDYFSYYASYTKPLYYEIFNIDKDIDYIKVMVFADFDKIMPLSNPEIIDFSEENMTNAEQNGNSYLYRGHFPGFVSSDYQFSACLEEGWYIFFDDELQFISDKPSGLTVGGRLFNYNSNISGYDNILQVIIPNDNSDIYTRNIFGSNIGKWQSLLYTDNDNNDTSYIPVLAEGLYINENAVTEFPDSLSGFYDLYDQLLSYSNVTKNIIGFGSKSDGTADTDLPIYEYVIGNPISSPQIWQPPKILLTSGVHSDEKTSMMALYNVIASLFDVNNKNALAIRNSVTIKVVPCVNPWGYSQPNNNGRLNARGVNINRNFSYNWNASTTSEKGVSQYSELETQALRVWLENNSDAVFCLDCHNSALSPFYLASN